MQPSNNTDNDAASVASSSMDIDSSPDTFPVPSSADTARKRNALETEMEDVKREIKAIKDEIADARESGDTVKVQYLTSLLKSEKETYRLLLQKERDLFLSQTAQVQQNIEYIDQNLNVVIKDNGVSERVPVEYLKSMTTLYEFVRFKFPDRNIVLYEEHLVQNEPCFVRLLVPPRHDAILVLKEKRLSPRVERRYPAKEEPQLKRKFPVLYRLVQSSLSNELLDQLARVTFVPARQLLGDIAKEDAPSIPLIFGNIANEGAPSIPVIFEGQKYRTSFIFHQENIETDEMKKVKGTINKEGSLLLQLVGVSGCGKTTTVFGIGMRERMIYCAGESSAYSTMSRLFSPFPTVSRFTDLFQCWVLTRLLLIVYFQQEFDFDFVDLMAAQNSKAFDLLHDELLTAYWQYPMRGVNDYYLLMTSYPSLICIDECHTILMRQDWSDKTDAKGELLVTYDTLWTSLNSPLKEASKLVLILLTTQMSDFIQNRINSASAKFENRKERFELFHEFTFYDAPHFMNLFVEVPENIQVWLAGRARIGTHMLQLVIENALQFTDENYESLMQALFQQFYEFHVEKRATESGCLSDVFISLRQNIEKHSRLFSDSSKLKENLLLLMVNNLTGKRQLAVEETRSFIHHGIGFLEAIPENPTEFYVSLREPLMTRVVMQCIGTESLCDYFVHQLEFNRQTVGDTDPSKGILFQYAVTTALMTKAIQQKTLEQLLTSWTGKTREELIKIADWIEPLLKLKLDISFIQRLRKNSEFTSTRYHPGVIYVLPNDGRSEIMLFIRDSEGNVFVVTLGVKMIGVASENLFEKNVSAATFDRLFLTHEGHTLERALSQRTLAENMVLSVVGNIALVVTLPTNFPEDHATVTHVYDSALNYGTLHVYIDYRRLHHLLGNERAQSILAYYPQFKKRINSS